MRIEQSVSVNAPREVVWAVLVDVETWPQLTDSVTSLNRLETGPLRVGSRASIKQPRLPTSVWTVTELVDQERFTWDTTGPGWRTHAVHDVIPAGPGSCTLHLLLEITGPVGEVMGRLTAGTARRYVGMEAEGIKRHAEAQSRGPVSRP
jgi:carbon monoxide dehydrogenase subunit G